MRATSGVWAYNCVVKLFGGGLVWVWVRVREWEGVCMRMRMRMRMRMWMCVGVNGGVAGAGGDAVDLGQDG